MNIRIFEVGGSIRNELMGLPANDRDFSVLSPDYDTIKQFLIEHKAKIYQERPQFVSIRANLEPFGAVDFTLARKESFYTDGRHPDSVSPADCIEDDLARRDFRFNAMAREVGSEKIIDPYDGASDIHNCIIQSVRNAADRFDEDRLRIFRAMRFACQLNFEISDEIHNAIDQFKSIKHFESVSSERMQIELNKTFSSDWMKAIGIIQKHPHLWNVIKDKRIWFKPTLEFR
jgi:tRNA nucleotidyltransferase (CCA-adding enzyme)